MQRKPFRDKEEGNESYGVQTQFERCPVTYFIEEPETGMATRGTSKGPFAYCEILGKKYIPPHERKCRPMGVPGHDCSSWKSIFLWSSVGEPWPCAKKKRKEPICAVEIVIH